MESRGFYNEILTEHNLRPEFKHDLPDADIVLEGVNPSCGDDIWLKLKVENDEIVDGAFVGDGCAISQASADIMLDLIIGKSEEEARHLADLLHRQARRHRDQHKGAALGAGLQRWGQLVEHIGHHLGLYAQKDEVADAGDLLIRAAGAAELVRQRLCLGRRAVGQQHIPGACTLADRTGHCAAHIAAAQKTDRFHHNSYPPLRQTISACLHCKHAGR